MKNRIDRASLVNYGLDVGFKMIRIIPAEEINQWDTAVRRLTELDADSEDYWKRTGLKFNPKIFMTGASSIIVAARPYAVFSSTLFKNGYGRYSAHYANYPKGRKAALKLAEYIKNNGFRAAVDPPLPAKAIAQKAGIGFFGKNGIIHNREFGSFFTLHMILTDAVLEYDPYTNSISDCGDCRKCMDECPTGAIVGEGTVIPGRCLRYHMLSNDFIPVELRDGMNLDILGCERCQLICPRNSEVKSEVLYEDDVDHRLFDIDYILSNWNMGLKQEMNRIGGVIGKNYARAQRIISMSVIYAGNTGDPRYIESLCKTLQHSHPPIRGHSAWALGKIGGQKAKACLLKALEAEEDKRVIGEITAALKLK